jgi:hypothetical protein
MASGRMAVLTMASLSDVACKSNKDTGAVVPDEEVQREWAR